MPRQSGHLARHNPLRLRRKEQDILYRQRYGHIWKVYDVTFDSTVLPEDETKWLVWRFMDLLRLLRLLTKIGKRRFCDKVDRQVYVQPPNVAR